MGPSGASGPETWRGAASATSRRPSGPHARRWRRRPRSSGGEGGGPAPGPAALAGRVLTEDAAHLLRPVLRPLRRAPRADAHHGRSDLVFTRPELPERVRGAGGPSGHAPCGVLAGPFRPTGTAASRRAALLPPRLPRPRSALRAARLPRSSCVRARPRHLLSRAPRPAPQNRSQMMSPPRTTLSDDVRSRLRQTQALTAGSRRRAPAVPARLPPGPLPLPLPPSPGRVLSPHACSRAQRRLPRHRVQSRSFVGTCRLPPLFPPALGTARHHCFTHLS